MDKEKDLAQLFSELQAFLQVLERESLSGAAESKKVAVAELLQDLNGSACAEHSGFADDADYMFMSCVTPLEDRSGTQLRLKGETQNALQIIEDLEDVSPSYPLTDEFQVKETQADPPPVPARHHQDPAEDSYEEAEPHSPVTRFSANQADSDSSHYESYGEEEAGVTGSRACPSGPLSAARICGLLWRRQWLGRWSKQLFLIKDQVLMCYKYTKDQYPLMAIHLHRSRVLYKFKRSKKIQHQLKITTASNETVVLGLQSREEAEDWRKIIEEVSNCTHYRSTPWDSPKVHKSASHKTVLRAARSLDLDRFTGEVGTVGAASRGTGYLRVLVKEGWQTLWCHLEDRTLLMYRDSKLLHSVHLPGCEVGAAEGTAHKCRLTISRQRRELAVLQTSSSEERDQWLHLLRAECATETESTHLYEETPLPSRPQNTLSNGIPVSGLLLRRVTTPNAYMDEPFGQGSDRSTPEDGDHSSSQHLRGSLLNHQLGNRERVTFAESYHHSVNNNSAARYNTLPSAIFLKSWSDFETKMPGDEKEARRNQSTQTEKKDFKEAMDSVPEKKTLPRLEEKIRQLEQAVYRAKERVKSGSELNLLSLSKTFKRASCGQTLALFSSNSETAHSEGAIVNPMLRRAASAKSCLRRTPSVLGVEKGRVLQKTKSTPSDLLSFSSVVFLPTVTCLSSASSIVKTGSGKSIIYSSEVYRSLSRVAMPHR